MKQTHGSYKVIARNRLVPSRTRMLAGASFLMVGLAIGNWPAQANAHSTLNVGPGVAGPITGTVS